jgi:hypothetical protein
VPIQPAFPGTAVPSFPESAGPLAGVACSRPERRRWMSLLALLHFCFVDDF